MTKINKTRHQLSPMPQRGSFNDCIGCHQPMVQWIFHLFQFKYYHIKVRHLRQTYNFFKYLSSVFWQLSAVWFFPILWAIWTHVNSSMYRYVRSLLILLFGSELINSSATAICCRIFSSSSCNLIFLNSNCDFFSVYIG